MPWHRKFETLALLQPDLAEAAHARLEQERAAAHARVEAVYADYRAAGVRYSDAADAEEDALTAICAHRCASFEELAEKARGKGMQFNAMLRPEMAEAIDAWIAAQPEPRPSARRRSGV